VVILGDAELEAGTVTFKDMHEGEQHQVSLMEGVELVKAR
jgi:histidyl-tRNA synthetase